MTSELKETVAIPRWMIILFIIPTITLVFFSGIQYQRIDYIAKSMDRFQSASETIASHEARISYLEKSYFRQGR